MDSGYVVQNDAAVALAAGVAKSILAAIQAAGVTGRVVEVGVSFDGVSATAVPVLVELCQSDGTTPGTSTAFTPRRSRGLARTGQGTGAVNYTAEPTVLTPIRTWLVHPQSGQTIQLPLGREPERVGVGAWVLRCNAPAAVSARGYLEIEEG